MKKILITGANSYIGTSFEKYIKENYPNDYIVDTVDMVDGSWCQKSFAGYDSVFHVAGIAHQKETRKNAHLYNEINRDLSIRAAKKAKNDGVNQFIFLSSMSVYGKDTGVIKRETIPKPKSYYGVSKWEAEQEISKLAENSFCICILRPPMVYGKGCKGNFGKIKNIVEKLPIFPYAKNKRSMIYIDNLCSFVKLCVDETSSGIYFPQNKEYISTIDLVKGIAKAMNKKIYLEYITGVAIMLLRMFHPMLKKAFGTLIYDIDEAKEYCVVDKEDSIKGSV